MNFPNSHSLISLFRHDTYSQITTYLKVSPKLKGTKDSMKGLSFLYLSFFECYHHFVQWLLCLPADPYSNGISFIIYKAH